MHRQEARGPPTRMSNTPVKEGPRERTQRLTEWQEACRGMRWRRAGAPVAETLAPVGGMNVMELTRHDGIKGAAPVPLSGLVWFLETF